MIRKELEDLVVTGDRGLKVYENYLDSYNHIFSYLTWKCLNTPVHRVYSLGSTKHLRDDFTLIEAYKNYIAKGKLYEMMSQFWNYGTSSATREDYLADLLMSKGYNLEILVEELISKFKSSYLEKIQYTLNQTGTRIRITELYNTEVLRTIKTS